MEETLKQILSELKNMRIDINELKQGQQNLESGQKVLEVGQQHLEAGQKVLEVGQQNLEAGQKRLEAQQQTLEAGLDRVENGIQTLQENLVDSLGLYTEKIVQHVDNKTEVLNKRVFKVESEIERLSRQ